MYRLEVTETRGLPTMWGSSNESFPMGEILRKLPKIVVIVYKKRIYTMLKQPEIIIYDESIIFTAQANSCARSIG